MEPIDSDSLINGLMADAKAYEAEKLAKIKADAKKPESGITMIDGMSVTKVNRQYIVEVPMPQGRTNVTFSEILRSRQSFEAVVAVGFVHNTEGAFPVFEQRLDLNSASAVSNLVTALNGAYGNKKEGYNWTLILNRANGAIKKIVIEERKSTNVAEYTYSEDEFLFFPFLQKDTANMVFGDGEVGKTFFCLSMVAHAITGKEFFGYTAMPMRTLLVDYETNEGSFSNRLHRIANGMGIAYSLLADSIEHYKPESAIRDETEIIARIVEEKKFDLIIIDAGADASGSPNDEDKVLMMFNSLNNIPCTKLIIHHEPKDSQGKDADKAYYGTTYWRNRVRQSYRLTVENRESPLKTIIKATNTKSNDAAREGSFTYSIEFSPKGSLTPSVTFARVDDFQPTDDQKIIDYLEEVDKATTNEIFDATGMTLPTLKRRLQELMEKDVIEREKDEGHVRRVFWRLPKG